MFGSAERESGLGYSFRRKHYPMNRFGVTRGCLQMTLGVFEDEGKSKQHREFSTILVRTTRVAAYVGEKQRHRPCVIHSWVMLDGKRQTWH